MVDTNELSLAYLTLPLLKQALQTYKEVYQPCC
jgi:hypothetical protein